MVNMANRSNVYMGLVPAVGLLCLCSKGSPTYRYSTLQDKKNHCNDAMVKDYLKSSSYFGVSMHTHQFKRAVQEAW